MNEFPMITVQDDGLVQFKCLQCNKDVKARKFPYFHKCGMVYTKEYINKAIIPEELETSYEDYEDFLDDLEEEHD